MALASGSCVVLNAGRPTRVQTAIGLQGFQTSFHDGGMSLRLADYTLVRRTVGMLQGEACAPVDPVESTTD